MAFKDVYGYDWQGDSILLARENLLFSYVDYYKARFGGKVPKGEEFCETAEILSWNIWQMDGLKLQHRSYCLYSTQAVLQ